MKNNQKNSPDNKRRSKDTKKNITKSLFQVLKTPMSRRMAVTELGYPDLTYLVTQEVNDFIRQGRAECIGVIKCTRSGRFVQKITTNPKYFKRSNQPDLFGEH